MTTPTTGLARGASGETAQSNREAVQPSAPQGTGGDSGSLQSQAPVSNPNFCSRWASTNCKNIKNLASSIWNLGANTLKLVWGFFTGCFKANCCGSKSQTQEQQETQTQEQQEAQAPEQRPSNQSEESK